VAVATLTVASVVAPAAAVTPLVEADVAALTTRAEAWTAARNDHREGAREQALALADDARQAEADRLAAEEAARIAAAERRAAEEIARTSTTTTTAPPTTTTAAVPPTTNSPDGVATTEPTTTEPPAPDPGEPSAAQWAVLRQCESSGNYGSVSANGRYRGAYQFSQATWDWIAGLDHPSLVGIDPAAATPADQDAMALALWRRRGWSPWPICGAQAASA
jgi:hypothetical protein